MVTVPVPGAVDAGEAGADATGAVVGQVDLPGAVDVGDDVAPDAVGQHHDQLAGAAVDVDRAAVEGLRVADAR